MTKQQHSSRRVRAVTGSEVESRAVSSLLSPCDDGSPHQTTLEQQVSKPILRMKSHHLKIWHMRIVTIAIDEDAQVPGQISRLVRRWNAPARKIDRFRHDEPVGSCGRVGAESKDRRGSTATVDPGAARVLMPEW